MDKHHQTHCTAYFCVGLRRTSSYMPAPSTSICVKWLLGAVGLSQTAENNTAHNDDESCSWKPRIHLLQHTGKSVHWLLLSTQWKESPWCRLYVQQHVYKNERKRSSCPHNLLLSAQDKSPVVIGFTLTMVPTPYILLWKSELPVKPLPLISLTTD